MINTSVPVINFTCLSAFYVQVCLNGVYGGMVLGYVVMFLCFILGTPAHSWLIWLYLHAGQKIKPTQVFPLNLTVLELMLSISCAVYLINTLINNYVIWIVMFSVVGSCWVGRPLMQVCVCVEQYLAVLHPIMFLRYKGVQYRIAVDAVVWMMAVVYTVYQDIYAKNFPNCMFNILFLMSVIIISFCCISVLRALKHPGPGDTQISMERGRDVGNQQKRNAFNTIFSGLLIILFTFLPQVSLSLINVSSINGNLFYCNILPTMSTLNILSVIITPLRKIYKSIVKTKKISGSL